MKALDKICPRCGARLTADYKQGKYICEYCGSEYEMEGASTQSSKAESHNTSVKKESTTSDRRSKNKVGTSHNIVLWIIGWVLVFPIPLTIIMLKNKNILEKLSKKIRYGIIVAAWIIYIIIAFGGDDSTPSASPEATNNTSATTNVTEEITEGKAPSAQELTGMKLLAPDGHPTLLGKSSDAHKVWNSIPSEKVLFPDSTENFTNGVTAVSLSGYRYREEGDPTITDIILDPPSAGIDDMLLDTALQIVASYLPTEYLNEYYEFSNSFAVQPASEGGSAPKYYVIQYSLNSAGKSAYDEHKFEWGSIYIEIEEGKTDTINSIIIRIGSSPKWMSHLELNGYQEIDWHYDFMEK